jgi:hypothetical protein
MYEALGQPVIAIPALLILGLALIVCLFAKPTMDVQPTNHTTQAIVDAIPHRSTTHTTVE